LQKQSLQNIKFANSIVALVAKGSRLQNQSLKKGKFQFAKTVITRFKNSSLQIPSLQKKRLLK